MSIVEPFAAQEFFVDGFDDFEVADGIMSCVGFRLQHGEQVAVVRLVMSVCKIPECVAKREAALARATGDTLVLRRLAKHLS